MLTKMIADFVDIFAMGDTDAACKNLRKSLRIDMPSKLPNTIIMSVFNTVTPMTAAPQKDVHFDTVFGFTVVRNGVKYLYKTAENTWRQWKMNNIAFDSLRVPAYFLEMQKVVASAVEKSLVAQGLEAINQKNPDKALDIYFALKKYDIPMRVALTKIIYEATDINILTVKYDPKTREITGKRLVDGKTCRLLFNPAVPALSGWSI